MANTVLAEPTKAFFVEMLTRDIELRDAILDLLDNCVDGALRTTTKDHNAHNIYDGFSCEIYISEDSLEIHDNCGGIPRHLAENYAFRMGRNNDDRDSDIPTVGMYGIGMKRAFFKIGQEASVTTKNDNSVYKVTIPAEWQSSEGWEFPIEDLPNDALDKNGTSIKITKIYDKVKKDLNPNNKKFIEDLESDVSTHFAHIMERGFSFKVNDNDINPKQINFSITDEIQPFVYEAEIDNVYISLTVGFREHMISEEDEERETEKKYKREDAGWTVICNDRVVLLNNKERITGWGEADVPQYHNQFINISGVVEFKSTIASKLPLTTTKRGLDANSELYSYVKDFMREGTKIFTDHTNRWKTQREAEKNLFKDSVKIPAKSAINHIKDSMQNEMRSVPNKFDSSKNVTQKRFRPKLPTPPKQDKTKYISFKADIKDIKIVSEYIFEDTTVPAGEVGKACFEKVLSEAK